MATQDILLIIIVVQFAVIALLAFHLGKFVPPELISLAFGFAERKAAETPQQWDDETLKELRRLYERLSPPTTVAAPVDTPPAGPVG